MVDQLTKFDWHQRVEEHGSPLNILNACPMDASIEAIRAVGRQGGLDVQLHYAFKANKDIVFVKTAKQCGIGIDVASETELRRTLQAGVSRDRIVCTAAIKSKALVDRCLKSRVMIVIDNRDEWDLVGERARALSHPANVAIRLGGFRQGTQRDQLATRFGFDAEDDLHFLRSSHAPNVQVSGLHFHLEGHDASQRVLAIETCLSRIASLRNEGHPISFLDIGGGFPARTWDDPDFVSASDWFGSILDTTSEQSTIAKRLIENRVQLRCEPGRALLEGCGMTIARVEFCKPCSARSPESRDPGDWLIGLAMNHTQCHPTYGNQLVDPKLLPRRLKQNHPMRGRFVGDYCTEFEFIAQRTFEFPNGIERGDLVVFANTAAYQMHFLESSSHQNPLAQTLQVGP